MLTEYAVIQAAHHYVVAHRSTMDLDQDPTIRQLAYKELAMAVDRWSFSSEAGTRARLLAVLLKNGPTHATELEDLAWANNVLDALTAEILT